MRKGSAGTPKLVISAHLDTVFPEGTDVTIKEEDGIVHTPGIGDDARGLAALLSVLRALKPNDLKTVGDVMFVGTVGEEELGNPRGVKTLFRDHKDVDGFICVDGLQITRISNQGTGSRRYEFVFRGRAAHTTHSFQEFGLPSAIHAMGRAVAKISDLQTPSYPKTTFTVGTVRGGTSVNAIAGEARMAVDMRSNATEELSKLEARVLVLVHELPTKKTGAGVRQDRRRRQPDRQSAGRYRAGGLCIRSSGAARGGYNRADCSYHFSGHEHRLEPGDVSRHTCRDNRRGRGRWKLAFGQRVVQIGECLFWRAKRIADAAGTFWIGRCNPAGPPVTPGAPLN